MADPSSLFMACCYLYFTMSVSVCSYLCLHDSDHVPVSVSMFVPVSVPMFMSMSLSACQCLSHFLYMYLHKCSCPFPCVCLCLCLGARECVSICVPVSVSPSLTSFDKLPISVHLPDVSCAQLCCVVFAKDFFIEQQHKAHMQRPMPDRC